MQLPLIIADYLNGKTIYPSVRRFFNLLFCVSISSCLFEKIYFKYSLPDISDYKTIINFFIKGYFVVPFCIFLIVYGITYYIPMTLFSYLTYFKSVKLNRKIIEYQAEKDMERSFGIIRVTTKKYAPQEIKKEALINLYLEYKESLSAKKLDEFHNSCMKERNKVEDNFVFSFRAIVMICIFYSSIQYFGIFLFLFSLFSLIVFMFLLFIQYHFLDLLPVLIKKLKYEVDEYVKKHLSEKENS